CIPATIRPTKSDSWCHQSSPLAGRCPWYRSDSSRRAAPFRQENGFPATIRTSRYANTPVRFRRALQPKMRRNLVRGGRVAKAFEIAVNDPANLPPSSTHFERPAEMIDAVDFDAARVLTFFKLAAELWPACLNPEHSRLHFPGAQLGRTIRRVNISWRLP